MSYRVIDGLYFFVITPMLGFTFLRLPILLAAVAITATASANELIVNGGFELPALAGWSTLNQNPGGFDGSFYAASGTDSPLNAFPTAGPASGSGYAVSDAADYGVRTLQQSFVVTPGTTSAILSFDLFVNDWNGGGILNPAAPLDASVVDPTQFARVDLLSGTAGNFDVGAGVLQNFYLGNDGDTPAYSYTHYSFDITSLVSSGGLFKIRFAEIDNQFPINVGVDNVSVLATPVPEPSSLAALAAGFVVLRRRRKS